MAPLRRLLAPAALVALALASACAGPPVPTPVDGLPICLDFEQGHTKMEGSLRYPVRLRVLDGKSPVSKVIISGLRKADDPRPRTFLADTNASYTLEWAQCANERAPRPLADIARDTGTGKGKERLRVENDTGYDCGEATVYKTEKLETKKGDKASHAVTYAPPPSAGCWMGDPTPLPAPAPAAPDAGAPPPPAPADADAGAAPSPAADAGAGTAPAPAGAADAGSKK